MILFCPDWPCKFLHGPLARCVKLRVSDPDMHHGKCVAHVPWCMSGSLTSGFLWSRWLEKRSRHPRRIRNPQFCISGRRPLGKWVPVWLFQVPKRQPYYLLSLCRWRNPEENMQWRYLYYSHMYFTDVNWYCKVDSAFPYTLVQLLFWYHQLFKTWLWLGWYGRGHQSSER